MGSAVGSWIHDHSGFAVGAFATVAARPGFRQGVLVDAQDTVAGGRPCAGAREHEQNSAHHQRPVSRIPLGPIPTCVVEELAGAGVNQKTAASRSPAHPTKNDSVEMPAAVSASFHLSTPSRVAHTLDPGHTLRASFLFESATAPNAALKPKATAATPRPMNAAVR
jgi:hypothetical protein